ncbi:MAG TPA: isoprenylcysteine carboxylmethyltransferase family protein [Burkholderiales bacterium]|nr:isoprenylcysteine carboxylmethyltransferase family protein [Burkholderiales bacterium]
MKAPGSSTLTFVLFPIAVLAVELYRGFHIVAWFAPLLAWGFLQYYLVGRYRRRLGGGGPGMTVPPQTLVTSGPYAWCRNPMYLGHLIFLLGLALTFQSEVALGLLVLSIFRFHAQVGRDESRLRRLFGAEYETYAARVKRWLPYLY